MYVHRRLNVYVHFFVCASHTSVPHRARTSTYTYILYQRLRTHSCPCVSCTCLSLSPLALHPGFPKPLPPRRGVLALRTVAVAKLSLWTHPSRRRGLVRLVLCRNSTTVPQLLEQPYSCSGLCLLCWPTTPVLNGVWNSLLVLVLRTLAIHRIL